MADNDKAKLYEVIVSYMCSNTEYYAKSMVNNWVGIRRCTKTAAISDGEAHQKALEYLQTLGKGK